MDVIYFGMSLYVFFTRIDVFCFCDCYFMGLQGNTLLIVVTELARVLCELLFADNIVLMSVTKVFKIAFENGRILLTVNVKCLKVNLWSIKVMVSGTLQRMGCLQLSFTHVGSVIWRQRITYFL